METLRSPAATGEAAAPCRLVTAEEIAQYQEHGWVKLEGFLDASLVRYLRQVGVQKMGEDGASNPQLPVLQDYFNHEPADALADPKLRPLLEAVGRNAKALMQRRREIEVRYFDERFLIKLPASRPSRNAGNGATDFHQDLPNWALDRCGGMAFWIALTDLEPDAGTMSFVDGSQKLGPLGNYRTGDLLKAYPEIRERCTITEAFAYKAGDATVHSALAVHGAGENLTGDARWAYSILVNPSDARWSGAPAEAYDTTGMVLHQELDDERFPVLSR